MKTYKEILFIPEYLIQGLSDAGATETIDDGCVDKDDLRLCIDLSGSNKILVGLDCRLVVTPSGIAIEGLQEVLGR